MANTMIAPLLFMAVIGMLTATRVSSVCTEGEGRLNIDYQQLDENSPEVRARVEEAELAPQPRGCIMFNRTYRVYETVTIGQTSYRCTVDIPISYCVSTKYCRNYFSYDYYHPLTGYRYKYCRCCNARSQRVREKFQLDCGSNGPCVNYYYTYYKMYSCDCGNCLDKYGFSRA